MNYINSTMPTNLVLMTVMALLVVVVITMLPFSRFSTLQLVLKRRDFLKLSQYEVKLFFV